MSWRDDCDYILDNVDFTSPVEVADCKAVQTSLRGPAPAGAKVEVYWRRDEGVKIRIDVAGEAPYTRTKKVLK